MTYQIDIQKACKESLPVADEDILHFAQLALDAGQKEAELTLRFVDEEEMTHLNHTYRQQNKTTNVLAFPSDLPTEIALDFPFLGDVIVCPTVLLAESQTLKKTLREHYALIIMHGILHLLGYDHIKDDDAERMQAVEVKLLAELGYANPYNLEEIPFE